MKKYKFFAIFLLYATIFSTFCPSFATDVLNELDSPPAPPSLTLEAKGGILLNRDTGDVLFTQNADTPLFPASTTKIMTAYLTMKYGDPDAYITVAQGIYQGIPDGASSADLKAGEEMYVYELLQCLMIVSANEAANALAVYISGSIESFVELMNTEAAALGCTNTHFVNTNGLHDEDHYTTARDLSKIALAAMEYDRLVEICSSSRATIRATNLSQERTLVTTNYLLTDSDFPAYIYPCAYGLKTGFTTPAGYCLVSCAYWDGMDLLSVVLGASRSQEETDTPVGSFTESIRLLDWGFYNFETALAYQKFLEEQLEPSPEPTPMPSPIPSPTQTPTPTPTPTPTSTPSPSSTPSPAVTPTPVPTPSPSPDTPETLIRSAANSLGIPAQTLLLYTAMGAGLLFFVVLGIFICILKRSSHKK